jgi:hypothetical protein
MQTWESQVLEFWLAMAYSFMRVVPYPLRSLHDSLCNGPMKTKEPDVENHPKLWQDFQLC